MKSPLKLYLYHVEVMEFFLYVLQLLADMKGKTK